VPVQYLYITTNDFVKGLTINAMSSRPRRSGSSGSRIVQPARPSDLPDFKQPPLSEVVLSIQFAPLQKFGNAHVGLFWRTLRSRYPKVTELPALPAAFETFGAPARPMLPGFQFETLLAPPMSRYWFEKEGEPDLLQIQQDRLIHNWRRQNESQVYPRYERVRALFRKEMDAFTKFVATEGFGDIRPNQCEVTYVNTIDLPAGSHRNLQEICPLWSGETSAPIDLQLENSTVQLRYFLKEDERNIGRLYVGFTPAVKPSDLSPVFRIDITARAKPREESISAAFDLLDHERDKVVRAFAAVTTPQMHEIWERTDARR
jgi:uncharacterized protein (TIGR04255 family)